MNLTINNLNELLGLAIEAGKRAGCYIQSNAGKHVEVQTKEGGSSQASQVVTEVDVHSQRVILETLSDSIFRFDLGLLTEELQDDSSRHERDYFWCIDPLDGTLPFTENVAGYSVSIALVRRDGVPVIGVILDPVRNVLYHAMQEGGAFRNNEHLVLPRNDQQGLTLVMDRSFQQHPHYEKLLELTEGIAHKQRLSGIKIINQGGAAMNACWVIENAPAVYFKLPKTKPGGGSLWDYAASACLFSELDAVATDIHGAPLKLNRVGSTFMNDEGVVYASNVPLAEAICQLHREFC